MKRFLALATTCLLIACNDDGENDFFTLTRDGVKKNVSVKAATLTVREAEDSDNGQGSHVLKIKGSVAGDSLEITISNWDFQEPPEDAINTKNYYNNVDAYELAVGEHNETCMRVTDNVNVCGTAIISYTINEKLYYSFSNENETLIIQITQCGSLKLSGNFDLTLQNPYNTEETIQISGVFTDLMYSVKHI